MKKICRISFAFLIVIFSAVLLCSPSKCYAQDDQTNYNNYIILSIISNPDGSMVFGGEFATDYSQIEQEKLENFQKGLIQTIGKISQNLKEGFIAKYQADENLSDDYLPENISFSNYTNNQLEYFGFEIKFLSHDVFKYYLGLTERELKEGMFISSLTQYSDMSAIEEMIKNIKQQVAFTAISTLNDVFADKYDPVCYLDIETFNERVKSDAGDILLDKYGFYHHIWQLDENTKSANIRLRTANKGWWYFFALVAPLTVMGVIISTLSIVKIIKSKKAKM